MSRWSPYAAGALFVSAGVMHFAKPDFFESIVPDWFPKNAEPANQLSGAAEIALGIGMWVPQTRRASALGLLALTAAVYPANIDMALNKVEAKTGGRQDGAQRRHRHGTADLLPSPHAAPARLVVVARGERRCVSATRCTFYG